jgi:hypothetical protein
MDKTKGVVTVHWTAASWMRTGDEELTKMALKEVDANLSLARNFGHQRTIAALLYLTPQLEIPSYLMNIWLRFVLYQNALREL